MWGLQNEFTYVGSTIPASGSYIGQLIQVTNAAVPSGRSILRWNGAIWAPPAGELIVAAWRTPSSALADISPGVTTLTKIWESPIIPDYMTPDGIIMRTAATLLASNSSPVSGCVMGVSIRGSVPVGVNVYDYPIGVSVTPGVTQPGNGLGILGAFAYRSGSLFRHGAGSTGSNQSIIQNSAGPFTSGANRAYAMAKPSGSADRIILDGFSFTSEGNL